MTRTVPAEATPEATPEATSDPRDEAPEPTPAEAIDPRLTKERRELVAGIISQVELSLRHIRCARSEQLLRTGVSLTHLHVIWQLEDHGGSLPMGRLADLLGVSMSNLTGLVDRMEERGLAERVRPNDDRRVVHVRPTTEGIEAARAFELLKTETLTRVLHRLDDAQLARVVQAIEDVRTVLTSEWSTEPSTCGDPTTSPTAERSVADRLDGPKPLTESAATSATSAA